MTQAIRESNNKIVGAMLQNDMHDMHVARAFVNMSFFQFIEYQNIDLDYRQYVRIIVKFSGVGSSPFGPGFCSA